jgi:hypothetical protein
MLRDACFLGAVVLLSGVLERGHLHLGVVGCMGPQFEELKGQRWRLGFISNLNIILSERQCMHAMRNSQPPSIYNLTSRISPLQLRLLSLPRLLRPRHRPRPANNPHRRPISHRHALPLLPMPHGLRPRSNTRPRHHIRRHRLEHINQNPRIIRLVQLLPQHALIRPKLFCTFSPLRHPKINTQRVILRAALVLCKVQRDGLVAKDVRAWFQPRRDVHAPRVVVVDQDVRSPLPRWTFILLDKCRLGVVDFRPPQLGFIHGETPVCCADAGREVREDGARVVVRPAVPLHVDVIPRADGGVRGGRCGGEVARDFGGGVVGWADEARVGVGRRPGNARGGVWASGPGVVARVDGAVDDDVGQVGVGEDGGGDERGCGEEDARRREAQWWYAHSERERGAGRMQVGSLVIGNGL